LETPRQACVKIREWDQHRKTIVDENTKRESAAIFLQWEGELFGLSPPGHAFVNCPTRPLASGRKPGTKKFKNAALPFACRLVTNEVSSYWFGSSLE
jgi:hypothetical protein